jgi:hypothetical protein
MRTGFGQPSSAPALVSKRCDQQVVLGRSVVLGRRGPRCWTEWTSSAHTCHSSSRVPTFASSTLQRSSANVASSTLHRSSANVASSTVHRSMQAGTAVGAQLAHSQKTENRPVIAPEYHNRRIAKPKAVQSSQQPPKLGINVRDGPPVPTTIHARCKVPLSRENVQQQEYVHRWVHWPLRFREVGTPLAGSLVLLNDATLGQSQTPRWASLRRHHSESLLNTTHSTAHLRSPVDPVRVAHKYHLLLISPDPSAA